MRANLEQVYLSWGLPVDAVTFLGKLWDAIQALDDVKDGDPVKDVDAAIYTLVFDLPFDPFLARNRVPLAPLMATAYYKWQAANAAEAARDKAQLDKAYVWRASYYDVVLGVAVLCLPPENVQSVANEVMALYGETREEYRREFE